MPDNEIPGLTRSEDLLKSSKSASERLLENPFVNAAAHTLIQGPADAAAQVLDRSTGSNLLPHLRMIPDARKAEFGTSDWFQQQVGGAVGALPYLIILHQGARSALSNRMLSADTRILLSAGAKLGPSGAGQLARLELASSGLTGLAYGGLLTPVSAENYGSNTSFLEAKLRNATVGAGTFMTLSGGMFASRSMADKLNPGIVKTVMGSNIGSGVLAGLPAGLVSAQADSILSGKGAADAQTSAESMFGFALIGGLMPAGQKGIKYMSEFTKSPTRASEVTALESLSPRDIQQLKNPGSAPQVKGVEQIFTPKEMKTINEWKAYQEKLPETNFRQSNPEMIQSLADAAYGSGAAVKGRQLHILLGNCGAGKSRITDALARELGAMTPDSDNIKPKIPGYERGMGNQAVHEDSSAAYKILLDRALANGDNIIWQGVGKTAQSVKDLAANAKAQNYDVFVHMIDAPPEVAARRVFNRANQAPEAHTGIRQMIPPEVPINPKYQYVPRQNFFKMVGEAAEAHQTGQPKLIDGFRLWRSTSTLNDYLPTTVTLPQLKPSWVPPVRIDESIDGPGLFKVKKNSPVTP